jgi:ABC-2 type transport system ATP-binding protein
MVTDVSDAMPGSLFGSPTTVAYPATVTTPAPRDLDHSRDDVVFDGVTRRFGDVVALDGISLTVPTGVLLGVIGPSGAGKTSAVKIMTGSLRPTAGQVRVLGEDPGHFRRRTRSRIGYMPQLFSLYPDLTAGENVDFVASLFGLLVFRRRKRVRAVLELVDLWSARKRRAADLSGGMQRRLELACALVHDPAILFLDEPTAGLDPLLRQIIWAELHRLRDAGRTILTTTQYVGEAEECDAVALISEGRLAALATPGELRRSATGGDVLEVETASPVDAAILVGLPMVRSVASRSERDFLVTVDDAGVAMPAIVGAIEASGGAVTSSREYRPSFDDVFATLVARHREEMSDERASLAAGSEPSGQADGTAA